MRLFNSNLCLHVYLYNLFTRYGVFVWYIRNTSQVDRETMTISVFWKRDKWKEFFIRKRRAI